MPDVDEVIKTNIPARLDRLPWCRWHWLIVISLGTVWILDGLEVTIKGAVGASLKDSIGFSTVQVAGSASIYILGAITGALVWGYLTDRFGRKRLFIITLLVYLLGVTTTATAGLWVAGGTATYAWFAVGRVLTGFGIGGEYSAINSAIDELIPARVRGTVDLVVNGSYWLGAAVAAFAGYLYLSRLPSDLGWRIAFATGAVVAIGVLLLRLFVPESPRWLMIHGHKEEAERIADDIERRVQDDIDEPLPEAENKELELRARKSTGFLEIGRTVFKVYPRRSVVGFSLMASQAFLYNALFFTYGLMLTTFYGVSSATVGLFLLPFAAGNFLGPILLGHFFDRVGRRPMIGSTFILGGLLAVLTGWLFQADVLSVWWQTAMWVFIFFFASAGASAGYLTVSETFPLEIRAMVIAFFYAIGTGISGILGPWLFGRLISSEARIEVFWGYAAAGAVMVIAGIVHATMGVEAEQTALEEVAAPLSVEEARDDEHDQKAGDEASSDAERQTQKEPETAEWQSGDRRQPGRLTPRSPQGGFAAFEDDDGRHQLEHETEILHQALAQDGPASPRELGRRVRSKYWGPGQLRQAIRLGMRTDRITQENGRLVATGSRADSSGAGE
jgi:MFS family permease